MVKATSKKTSSSAKKLSAGSKKIASRATGKTAPGANKKTANKKVAVEKVELSDSEKTDTGQSKTASKKKVSSSAASTKKTTAKSTASKKKTAKKNAAGKKVASSKPSSSSTAPPASTTKAKKKAAAKIANSTSENVVETAAPSEVKNKKVAKKAASTKSDISAVSEVVDFDQDDDLDSSDLPTGLSKAPVPYERNAGHYMDPAQLSHFSEKLAEWKQQLMEEVDRTVGHMKDDATNFPDPNDRATQEEEFSLELRTRDRERKLIKKINEAQKRIDDDEYGYCETCGIEIGVNRLEARPTAELCIDCKTLEEIRERQTA